MVKTLIIQKISEL